MSMYPDWTEKQFRELLASEDLSNEELGERIGRTPGAVGWVRAGVKNWRQRSGDTSMLSKMMKALLSDISDRE